ILQTGPQNLGASFTFVNLTGQKLDDYIVNSTTQQIPTSTLPPGTYTWTISRGNSLIESGKWIKQ
ncbi:MAG: T9SS type A sorting domain-containing protein, partial [Lentimicrobiaceae bacterium]